MDDAAQFVRVRPRRPIATRIDIDPRGLAGALGLMAICLAIGAAVPRGSEIVGDEPALFLIPLGAIAALAVASIGPVACLAAVVGLTAAGLRTPIADLGGLDVAVVDFFYAGLFLWWGGQALARVTSGQRQRHVQRFGQLAAFAFLAFAGLSLLFAAWQGSSVDDPLVSWLRLAQTATLAWLAASVIQTRKDLDLVIFGFVAGAVFLEGSVIVDLLGDGDPTKRFGGLIGPNTVGMIGGVLLMFAFFYPRKGGRFEANGWFILLLVCGLAGLLLGKSVGAFVATGLALAVGFGFRSQAVPLQRMGAVMMAIGVGVFFTVGLVQFIRPSAAPTSAEFGSSSTSHRAIVGAAAVEVFERHPVFGVGWRRTEDPSLIASREINVELRARFQGAKNDFFPDTTPTSVHNSYLQVLADTGIVGFGLLLAFVGSVAIAIRKLLQRIGRADPLWPVAWTLTLSLLLIGVWLNDNPLYGGQIETVALATIIGGMAAMSRLVARRDDEQAAGGA